MPKIYLAGPISGLTYNEAQDWRVEFRKKLDPRIEAFSPLRGKSYLAKHGALQGAYEEYPLSTAKGITTRDRMDCMGCDLVVFNLKDAEKVSIGTMIEFGWADAARRPTVVIDDKKVSWTPADGSGIEPRTSVHDHPMVEALTSFRVDNLNDAVKLVELILLSGNSIDMPETTPETMPETK